MMYSYYSVMYNFSVFNIAKRNLEEPFKIDCSENNERSNWASK